MLSLVDHEKSFITSGPDLCISVWIHSFICNIKIIREL